MAVSAARAATMVAIWTALVVPGAAGQALQPPPLNLATASLEDLMNIEVTSVARKEQRVVDTASAVTVISQDEIRRSGATTIAELLRSVPGMQVAHIDANKWAVSARGSNGRFANKMLVLVDGRTVYTPLFSGVYWDVQDLLLDDIDRIEVVRGPGAALWGANAVNGVINIITKSAAATPGGIVVANAGSAEGGAGAIRYGGSVGAQANYRAYAKYFGRRAYFDPSGRRGNDSWESARSGFRVDWRRAANGVMVQGELYQGSAGQTLTPDGPLPFYSRATRDRTDTAGGFALGRWTRALQPGADLALQVYIDRNTRHDSVLGQDITIADVDFQHHFPARTRHDVVWGLSGRATSDRIVNGPNVGFTPTDKTVGLFAAFAQDELVVVPNRLRLTVGAKVEHNPYTGWELQPNARLLWNPGGRQTIWAAVSRAVRSPSRADASVRLDTITFPSGTPGVFTRASLLGDPDFASESVRAQEIGYRVQPSANVSVDVAAFFNVYRHLRTFEYGARSVAQLVPVVVVHQPLTFANQMHGHNGGLEMVANWDVVPRWRLTGTYAFIDVALEHDAGSSDTISIRVEDDSPRHRVALQSRLELPHRWEIDALVARTDRLIKQQIPAYTRLDLRLGWSPVTWLDVGVVGQNLVDNGHVEFGSTLGEQPTEVRRGILGTITWRF